MASGNPIRGSRIGAGPSGEARRGEAAPRRTLEFHCAKGHVTSHSFSEDADLPETWDCAHCGNPAGLDRAAPPQAHRVEPYKSHLAYVRERRSDEDGEALLAEALANITAKRNPNP